VGRITRICSRGFAAATLLCGSGFAEARVVSSPLADYARARVLTNAEQAAAHFAAALGGAPDNAAVAARAYRGAVIAGDYTLALRAMQVLERAGEIPPEGHLLLYIAALKARDPRAAAQRLQGIMRERSLAFIAPVLADWLRFGSRGPVELPDTKEIGGPNAYADESAALMALAKGETQKGLDAVRAMWALDPYRAQSLRLAAAATLAARGQRDDALKLLVADTLSTQIARERIAKRQSLGIAVNDSLSGTAFILARLAGDLTTGGSGTGAITLARFAQFADPENPRVALGVAGALAGAKRSEVALTAVTPLLSDPLYGDDAASLRIELLEALDRHDEAMAAAEVRAARSTNDAARLGDMAMRKGDFAEAAKRFQAALAKAGNDSPWSLWHAAGNAHLLSGDWNAARPALENAHRLAPEEPLVLNSLGFGLVDRGGDVARGKVLIERAAELRPGNASIIDSQGWAAFRGGDTDRAIAALERARSLAPVQADISEHLGDAYWAAGRRIDARYAWSAARVQGDAASHARLDTKIDRGLP
jgi:tetratricopeptide (TPR) repeat protein